jgi:hypothetical protein
VYCMHSTGSWTGVGRDAKHVKTIMPRGHDLKVMDSVVHVDYWEGRTIVFRLTEAMCEEGAVTLRNGASRRGVFFF